jgi:kynurenine formamidase
MADFDELLGRLSNWGKWGPDDEHGALNYITPEKRRAAAGLVRRGEVFALGLPLTGGQGPQRGAGSRVNPMHFMTATGCDPSTAVPLGGDAAYTDDFVGLSVQGSTQWDALCHIFYAGTMYNGFPASEVTSRGAARNGIDKVHAEFVSRGVLLDIARLHGVDCLDPGYPITTDDLLAAEHAQGVTFGEGDVVVVRTGQMSTTAGFTDWSRFHGREPGLHFATAELFDERRVAAIAADNTMVEATAHLPGYYVPFHMLALVNLGIHLGEFWFLEDLARDCAADGVYEFMLVAQALPITGGTGSPLNPLAIK